MLFETNKQKGNCGLAAAIWYFTQKGYTVSLPLNDTQDYDLVVDMEDGLKRVQCKATSQRSRYGITTVPLKSCGGTKGTIYKTAKDTKIDYLFVLNEEEEKWLIPIQEITQTSSMNLRTDSKFFLS